MTGTGTEGRDCGGPSSLIKALGPPLYNFGQSMTGRLPWQKNISLMGN